MEVRARRDSNPSLLTQWQHGRWRSFGLLVRAVAVARDRQAAFWLLHLLLHTTRALARLAAWDKRQIERLEQKAKAQGARTGISVPGPRRVSSGALPAGIL